MIAQMDNLSIKISLIFFISFTILSCGPKVIVGHYSSSINNKMSFSGKELKLNRDGSFILNEWTDNYSTIIDENGDTKCNEKKGKGKGTYELIKDSLFLNFENNDFISYELFIKENSNSYEINIMIRDEMMMPLEAVIISIMSKDNKTLKSILSEKNGHVHVQIEKDDAPQFLNISSFATKDIVINIPNSIGQSIFTQKRCLGYFKNGTNERMWFKPRRNSIMYKRSGGKIVKLKRWNNF